METGSKHDTKKKIGRIAHSDYSLEYSTGALYFQGPGNSRTSLQIESFRYSLITSYSTHKMGPCQL